MLKEARTLKNYEIFRKYPLDISELSAKHFGTVYKSNKRDIFFIHCERSININGDNNLLDIFNVVSKLKS